jgi:hypothetical protein
MTDDNVYVTRTGRYCIACRKETHKKRKRFIPGDATVEENFWGIPLRN